MIYAFDAAVALIGEEQLDEAELIACKLVAEHPVVLAGYYLLGLVHEERGQNRLAADCYRRVVSFLQQNPGSVEPAFEADFAIRIAELDPPGA